VDRFDKFYYDWSTEEFVKLDDLKESYDTIDWKCALSDRDIRSNINDFSPENFVHEEYHDTIGGDSIDGS